MPKVVAALLLFSVGALPAGVFERSPDVLKCGPRDGGDPDMPAVVILLDGEVFDGDDDNLLRWIRRESVEPPSGLERIQSLEVVCWYWVEVNYDVQARQGGVYILTKEWVERTRNDRIAALQAVVAAQDRHREQTGEYTAQIEDLPGFGALSEYGLPAHLQLDLTRTGDGWTARLVPKESWSFLLSDHMSPAYDCFAFAGTPPAKWGAKWKATQSGEATELEERTPLCLP